MTQRALELFAEDEVTLSQDYDKAQVTIQCDSNEDSQEMYEFLESLLGDKSVQITRTYMD
jgi:hypothetical protein